MSMIAKPADSLLENSKLDPQMAPRFPHFRFGISDLYQLFRGSQGSRQFLAATREQSGQTVRRQPRIVQEHAAHLVEHEARQILAGPTLFQEPTADGLQQLIAQLSRLSRNSPLVKSQHMGNVALAQAIAHSQAQDQDLVVGQLAQAFASGLTKGLVPTAVLLRGQGQSEVVFRKGLNAG